MPLPLNLSNPLRQCAPVRSALRVALSAAPRRGANFARNRMGVRFGAEAELKSSAEMVRSGRPNPSGAAIPSCGERARVVHLGFVLAKRARRDIYNRKARTSVATDGLLRRIFLRADQPARADAGVGMHFAAAAICALIQAASVRAAKDPQRGGEGAARVRERPSSPGRKRRRAARICIASCS